MPLTLPRLRGVYFRSGYFVALAADASLWLICRRTAAGDEVVEESRLWREARARVEELARAEK